MKTMKKIFALTLALMLVFSLALTANAVNLTVEGALKGAEYELYKIADVTKEDSGALVYTANDAWVDFLEDLSWIKFLDEDAKTFVRNGNPSEADMAAAAKAAKAYAVEKNVSVTATQTAEGETPAASFTGVGNGYYLMTSDKGSLCTLATITDEDTKIKEKNATLPNVKKTVDDEEVAIGDTVSFTLTVTTGENHNNEMNYVIHDKMSAGLTLDEDSIVVMHGDKNLVEETDYTVKTTGFTDQCTFEIVFKDTLTTKANEKITVTYTATVNENATATETNEAKIEDSSSTVTVKTTEFTLNKTDGTNPLAGAKFELYYATTTGEGESATTTYTKVPVVLIDEKNNVYRPVVAEDQNQNGVAIEAGTATVKGLDPDLTYYVLETKAPDGYVPIDDYKQLNGTVVEIENVKGEELPETGGMGTTLFYTLGGMMVAAAAVLLVTKKRMSAM